MVVQIVKIGNSSGIRIPKALLKQTGLSGSVELYAQGDSLVICPIRENRAGWDVAFAEMAANGDDAGGESSDSIQHSFDDGEWEW